MFGSRAFVLTGAARRRSRGHGKDKRAKPLPLTRIYLSIPYGAGLAGKEDPCNPAPGRGRGFGGGATIPCETTPQASIYLSLKLFRQSGRWPTKEGHPVTETKRPDLAAYVVRDREDKKSNWREIGVAFKHKDGKGLDLLLDAMPVSGRVVLRDIEDKGE